MFLKNPSIRSLEGGNVKGEDLFVSFGRTNTGRYLCVRPLSSKKNALTFIVLVPTIGLQYRG